MWRRRTSSSSSDTSVSASSLDHVRAFFAFLGAAFLGVAFFGVTGARAFAFFAFFALGLTSSCTAEH